MSDGDRERYERLVDDIRSEFPRFRLVNKAKAPIQRAIHYALIALTFGGMRQYLDGYHTTFGQRIYVPPSWDEHSYNDRYVVLRHELVHMRQFRRFTFAGMALLYGLLPLPAGLAYFRARFEQSAYAETIHAAAMVWGKAHVTEDGLRNRILSQFTGPAYGWMWPFRGQLERWYDRVLAEVDDG